MDVLARQGRSLLRIYQNSQSIISDPIVRAKLGVLLHAGSAMAFAGRLRSHGQSLSPLLAMKYANMDGIDKLQLKTLILPALKSAGVVEFSYQGGELTHIQEFVGVTEPLLHQATKVLDQMDPSKVERAVLHSVEVASWAPMTMRDHIDYLVALGFEEQCAVEATTLARAGGINSSVHSEGLNDEVVFNPYVWTTDSVPIASFLRNLPPNEKASLLGICEMVASRPGAMLSQLGRHNPGMLRAARKVGLIDGMQVVSACGAGDRQTFLFSPMMASAMNPNSSEALHERKLFLAHILYGHQMAISSKGRINSPVVLVESLLSRGSVGPATNIGTDYRLLEAAGIARVAEAATGPRLVVVKKDVVRDGLDLLRILFDGGGRPREAGAAFTSPATGFVPPEADRRGVSVDKAVEEVTTAAILELRKEAQRAACNQEPF